MKRISLLCLVLVLNLFAMGCNQQSQDKIGDAPSRAKSKAMQSEAQMQLKQIYTMQETYYRVNMTYTDDLNEMGISIPGNANYSYFISANGNGWTCEATANLDNDATIDRWVVDQSGSVRCAADDATS